MLAKDFFLAGKATFTISNPKGERYTYRINKPKDKEVFFISLLTGPENTRDYTYLGLLLENGEVKLTAKSKFSYESLPVKVIKWAMKLVWKEQNVPEGYKLQHMGRCGCCGRPLTVPESIESGLGPICGNR